MDSLDSYAYNKCPTHIVHWRNYQLRPVYIYEDANLLLEAILERQTV